MDKTNENKYWEGPYGVLVSLDVKLVVAYDGYNILYQNGNQTQGGMFGTEPYGDKEYKEEHATYNEQDSKWYYKV